MPNRLIVRLIYVVMKDKFSFPSFYFHPCPGGVVEWQNYDNAMINERNGGVANTELVRAVVNINHSVDMDFFIHPAINYLRHR